MPLTQNAAKWLLFAAISPIWGSSFILMKAGMTNLSPYQVAAIRILSGGLVLLPIAIRHFKELPTEKLGWVIITGFVGSFFPAFLFCIAETRIDSSLAGMLNALTPVFTILIGTIFFNIKVTLRKSLGILLGFAGLSGLFLAKGAVNLQDISYATLVLAATLCYGLNINLVNHHLKGVSAVSIAAIAFAFLLLPALLVLYFTGYFSLAVQTKPILLATGASVILGVLGTALATIFFYMLVKKAGPIFTSLVTYGIPFVAIAWGFAYGETINLLQVCCLGVILGGVWLVSRK